MYFLSDLAEFLPCPNFVFVVQDGTYIPLWLCSPLEGKLKGLIFVCLFLVFTVRQECWLEMIGIVGNTWLHGYSHLSYRRCAIPLFWGPSRQFSRNLCCKPGAPDRDLRAHGPWEPSGTFLVSGQSSYHVYQHILLNLSVFFHLRTFFPVFLLLYYSSQILRLSNSLLK